MASPKSSRAKAPSGARFADAMDAEENPGRYQRNLDGRVKVRTPRVGKGSPAPSPKANPPPAPASAASTAGRGAGAMLRGASRAAGAVGAAMAAMTPGTANAPDRPASERRNPAGLYEGGARFDRGAAGKARRDAKTNADKSRADREDRATKSPEASKSTPSRKDNTKSDRKSSVRETGKPLTDAEIAAWNRKNNKNFRNMKSSRG